MVSRNDWVTQVNAAIALALVVSAFIYPLYAWDLVGYLGNALLVSGHPRADLHAATFGMLQSELPEALFREYTELNDYRRTVYADSRSFLQQLPFYAGRPAYYGLMALASWVGVSLIQASVVVSAVSCAISMVLLSRLAKIQLNRVAHVAMPALMLGFGIAQVARLSTPDGLALLATVTVFYLYVTGNHRAMLWIAMPIAVFVRADLLFLTAAMCAMMFVRPELSSLRWQIGGSTFVQLLIAFTLQTVSEHPGWSVLIRFAFIEGTAYPLDASTKLSLAEYFQALANGLTYSAHDLHLRIFAAVVAVLLCVIAVERFSWRHASVEIASELSAITGFALASLARIAAFPLVLERFFLPTYCCVTFCLLSIAFKLRRSRRVNA